MSVTTNLLGTIPAVIGGAEETIEGTEAGEWIIGTDADNVIDALGGDDFVQALAGNDQIDAGDGNDTVLAGEGDDRVVGGLGDDVLRGDAGADRFRFDPSQEEGADSIVDFTQGEDVIVLSAIGLADLGLEEASGAALDESEDFSITPDEETGDLVIGTPGGTITLNGVTVPEGEDPPTFAELEEEGSLVFRNFSQGTDGADDLEGTEGDDTIDAGGGDDTITPLSGNDSITTGAGSDTVNIDPSNPDEGDDVITDFTGASDLDSTDGDDGADGTVEGDFINFALADLLEADPDLPAADGDANSLSLDDFVASPNWNLETSEGGSLLFSHPNGSVEFTDVADSGQTIDDLGAVIKVDGVEFTAPIPVDGGDDGADGGDDGADGGDDGADGGDDAADGGDDAADGGDDAADGGDDAADGGDDAADGGDDAADGEEDAGADDEVAETGAPEEAIA